MRLVSIAPIMGLLAPSGEALAGGVATPSVQIKRLRTGWDSEQFAVETVESYINPAACPTVDGYVATESSPGYRTHYAAVLAAISAGRKVQVVVSNADCVAGRPRIMGISLIP